MTEFIKKISIEAELPNGLCISDLSKKYKDITFKITNGHWISNDERIIYINVNSSSEVYIDFLKKHQSVKKVDLIGNVIRIHVKSPLLKTFEQKEMTIIYPTILVNGLHKVTFLINNNQLISLKKALKSVKIIKISDFNTEKDDLTERQLEILEKAVSFGYFKYPRDITLTDLAKLLKISKGTLSESLRIIENKAISLLLDNIYN